MIPALFFLAGALILVVNAGDHCRPGGAVANQTFPYPPPTTAPGWTFQHLTSSLVHPRTIAFDSQGTLLVLDVGVGIVGLRLQESESGDGCWAVRQRVSVVDDTSLTHGLALAGDGRSLYASSDTSVFGWTYDSSASLAGGKETLITGMTPDGGTRTLLIPRRHPQSLLVQTGTRVGANGSLPTPEFGQNQIKVFDLSQRRPGETLDFASNGRVLAFGLRNAVAVGEDALGGIWSLENGANPLFRAGIDVTADEPAEELNYHGHLDVIPPSTPDRSRDFGFPACGTVWNASSLPLNKGLHNGDAFYATSTNATAVPILPSLSPPTLNETVIIRNDDAFCADNTTRAALPLEPHLAPLDIKFVPGGDALFTSHGSTEAGPGIPLSGYKVAIIHFDGRGEPVMGIDGRGDVRDVLMNGNGTAGCPGACFRPTGLAIHPTAKGVVFVSADSTGDIFVLSHDG